MIQAARRATDKRSGLPGTYARRFFRRWLAEAGIGDMDSQFEHLDKYCGGGHCGQLIPETGERCNLAIYHRETMDKPVHIERNLSRQEAKAFKTLVRYEGEEAERWRVRFDKNWQTFEANAKRLKKALRRT